MGESDDVMTRTWHLEIGPLEFHGSEFNSLRKSSLGADSTMNCVFLGDDSKLQI